MDKTKPITKEEANSLFRETSLLTSEITTAIFMDHERYLLTTTANFIPLNAEAAIESPYALCTSVKELGDEQVRFIYFLSETDIKECGNSIFHLKDYDATEATVLNLIDRYNLAIDVYALVDELTFGMFPLQLCSGNIYSSAGLTLYKVEK